MQAAGDDSAQRLFNDGVDAARQNRWTDAREAFQRAYNLSQRPVVLINLAAAEVRTGRLKAAIEDYRRVMKAEPSADNAAFRKAAADVLPYLEAQVPRIRLHVSGLGSEDVVQIDGQAIPTDQLEQPHPVDPGSHAVVVERAGVERTRVSFAVAAGELHDISVPPPLETVPSVRLRVPANGPPGTDLKLVTDSGSSHPRAPRPVWRSPWLWTAVIAVAAGATIAMVFAVRHDEAFSGNLPPGTLTVQ